MPSALADNAAMAEHISLRVPDGVTERGQRVADRLAELPEYQAMTVTRSRALTLAMLRGLALMEEELGVTPPKRRKRKK